MQIFKISPKSICATCKHKQSECRTNELHMNCSSDGKTKTAQVDKCNGYERRKND